jgi:O-antigen/teichoic acid export membrane protein
MMGVFLHARGLGLYFVAQKMLVYSLGAVNSTLTDVLLPYNVEKYREPQTLCNYTSLNIKFLNLLSVVLGVLLVVFAPFVLAVFFPQYVEASSLIPLFVGVYLAKNLALVSHVYKALNRTQALAVATGISLMVTLGTGLFLIPSLGVPGLLLTEIVMSLSKNGLLWLNLKRWGYRVEVLPRFHDLVFFWKLGWKGIQKAIEKTRKQVIRKK